MKNESIDRVKRLDITPKYSGNYVPRAGCREYVSQVALLAEDLRVIGLALEMNLKLPKSWCLALANPPHPGYNKIDEKKRRWRYAAKEGKVKEK